MRTAWLSWLLLLLAYLTYGQFLQEEAMPPYLWALSVGFALFMAGFLTIFWTSSRRVILLGFKSDLGYTIMVLLLASLAVVAVVQFRTFSYLMVLFAASLLARVDTLSLNLNGLLSFFILTFFSLLGLGLSWVLPFVGG